MRHLDSKLWTRWRITTSESLRPMLTSFRKRWSLWRVRQRMATDHRSLSIHLFLKWNISALLNKEKSHWQLNNKWNDLIVVQLRLLRGKRRTRRCISAWRFSYVNIFYIQPNANFVCFRLPRRVALTNRYEKFCFFLFIHVDRLRITNRKFFAKPSPFSLFE